MLIHRWEKTLGVRRIALWLAVPLGVLAALLTRPLLEIPLIFQRLLAPNAWATDLLVDEGVIPGLATTFLVTLGLLVLILLSGAVFGLSRRPLALRFVRFCYGCFYLAVAVYQYVLFRVTGLLSHACGMDGNLAFVCPGDDAGFPGFVRGLGMFSLDAYATGIDKVTSFYLWWDWSWPVFLVTLCVAHLHVLSWRRLALYVYTGAYEEDPTPGDALIENLRTHGRDPRYRCNLYRSVGVHLAWLVVIPWLATWWGCATPYRVPKGSGNPAVAVVVVRKPEKKKKKEYILNPNSLVSFHIPDLDDSQIFVDVEQETRQTYQASANAKGGPMGVGGGKTGGWPDGMEDHLVRFIRLQYGGSNWDDGMDEAAGADRNFLTRFHELTGFKVARNGEKNRISLLGRYPPGYAPPFVYMTGSGRINVSGNDMKSLREYLLGGGMLFADAGSREFARAFRPFIERGVLPGYKLLNIADDDPIFQMPYAFPHGAPPLWHHGGMRAMGVRHQGGRWMVFYHPGDVNDAWKNGRSGLSRAKAEGAYEVGVNVVYHAFTKYLEATRKYRK